MVGPSPVAKLAQPDMASVAAALGGNGSKLKSPSMRQGSCPMAAASSSIALTRRVHDWAAANPPPNWAVNRKQVQRGAGPEHREAGEPGLKREAGQQREDSGGRSPNEPCN